MTTGVCIVGGSTAGLFAAKMLATKGIPVDLYDSGDLLKPSKRTLIVTSDFLKLPDRGFASIVRNRIHSFQLISPHRSIDVPLEKPDLVINRAELIEYLHNKALEAGVRVYVFHRLTGAERTGKSIKLQFSKGEKEETVCYKNVIAADGVDSALGRLFGCNGYRKVALLQYPVKLPKDQPPYVTRVWFDRKITPFFIWLIPETPSIGVVGIISNTMTEAKRGLDEFLNYAGLSPEGAPQSGEAPLPPICLMPPSSWNPDGLFFVGDAAAQVKATTVGGVVTGIRGAMAAAEAVITGKNYRFTALPLWQELMIHRITQSLLEECTNEDYDFMLASLNKYGLKVLSKYPRDRLFKAFALIALSQPTWTILGCRLLTKGLTGIPSKATSLLPSVSNKG